MSDSISTATNGKNTLDTSEVMVLPGEPDFWAIKLFTSPAFGVIIPFTCPAGSSIPLLVAGRLAVVGRLSVSSVIPGKDGDGTPRLLLSVWLSFGDCRLLWECFRSPSRVSGEEDLWNMLCRFRLRRTVPSRFNPSPCAGLATTGQLEFVLNVLLRSNL